MRTLTVDIPEWVIYDGGPADMAANMWIGRVVRVWRNMVAVEFYGRDGKTHLGHYTLWRHSFREPTLTDWIMHAVDLGDITQDDNPS